MTLQTQLTIHAARNKRQWGRWATVRFCEKRGIPRRLLTIACQLEAVKDEAHAVKVQAA